MKLLAEVAAVIVLLVGFALVSVPLALIVAGVLGVAGCELRP